MGGCTRLLEINDGTNPLQGDSIDERSQHQKKSSEMKRSSNFFFISTSFLDISLLLSYESSHHQTDALLWLTI